MRRLTMALVAIATLVTVAATGAIATACGGNSVQSDAIATVGGASVAKADFQELLTQEQAQMKASGMTVPAKGSTTYDRYVAQIVEYRSRRRWWPRAPNSWSSRHRQRSQRPDRTDREVLRRREEGPSLLKQQGMTMELLKRSIRNQILTQRAAAVVTKKATVSDAQIQAYWQAHKAQYLKKKKTNTLAKAKATIQQTLLSADQQQLWHAWLSAREKALGVAYAAGLSPRALPPSRLPANYAEPASASSSATVAFA